MRTVRSPGGQILFDFYGPSSETMRASPKAGCGHRIGGYKAPVPSQIQIITQGRKRDMNAVRNKTEPKVFAEKKGALDDVFVAIDGLRTGVAEVRYHAQSCIDSFAQLIKARIGMACGNDDMLIRQKTSNMGAWILFRRQCKNANQAAACIK